MLGKELISVILPTYNRKSLIERAIFSVIHQTYDCWELIIVDDGSTDGTREFLSNFLCDNLKIKYVYQRNQGVSAARNKGSRISQGKYIAFIDSDDEWAIGKLEKQIEFFKNNTEVELVFCNAEIIFPDGERGNKPELIPHTENAIFSLKEILADPYLGIPTVMMTKKLFISIEGFDENLRTSEDIDLFLKASLNHLIGYLHEKLVNVYKTKDSLSAFAMDGDRILAFENNINVFTKFIKENKNEVYKEHDCDINRIMFNLFLSYGRALLSKGRKLSARKQFDLAHKYKINFESIYLLLKSYLISPKDITSKSL